MKPPENRFSSFDSKPSKKIVKFGKSMGLMTERLGKTSK